jgi:MFS transporter, DHA1 family, multidrug resistance protein
VLLLASGVMVTLGIREEFTPPPQSQRRPSILAEWRRILRRPGVTPAYAVRFLNFLGPTMLLPVLPLFVAQLLRGEGGVSTFTGLVVGASSAAGTASALYLGRLGDRLGHRRVLIAATIAAALCFAPQFFVAAGWQLLVLQALTGAATGGMGPAISALLARYTPPGEEGVVYGLDNSISAAARAAAPLLGAGVAVWFGLRGIFIAAAIVLLASAAIVLRLLPERPPATLPAAGKQRSTDHEDTTARRREGQEEVTPP